MRRACRFLGCRAGVGEAGVNSRLVFACCSGEAFDSSSASEIGAFDNGGPYDQTAPEVWAAGSVCGRRRCRRNLFLQCRSRSVPTYQRPRSRCPGRLLARTRHSRQRLRSSSKQRYLLEVSGELPAALPRDRGAHRREHVAVGEADRKVGCRSTLRHPPRFSEGHRRTTTLVPIFTRS